MDTNLFRLRASELELLICLDDAAVADSVGRTIDELTDGQRIIAEDMESAGLVRFDIGWQGIGWYRLTALGRELVCLVRPSRHHRTE
jgi:hypothetical protein